MNFSIDAPIKTFKDDILHRSDFAKQFAQNLISITGENSFTVSLNGCWGSGKTSLLNLIKKELEHICETDESIKAYPIIVNFAPWNTLNEDAIISQFFNTFSNNFPLSKLKKLLNNNITKNITSGAIKILEKTPNIGPIIKELHDAFKKYFKCFTNQKEKDLETLKNELLKKLQNAPIKYIVFIDDIDRLNKKEIRLIIQLIKAVCDFPNVTYVLSFDKNIVADALSDEQCIDGNAYLEKIIQLSVNIPTLTQEDLNAYLFKQIDSLIAHIDERDMDMDRWFYIYKNGFSEYFNTLRNINRYINAIKFKFNTHIKVLNVVDFLVIEGITLFEPKLSTCIYENRFLLFDKDQFSDKKQVLEKFKTDVENISNKFEMLTGLFPILQSNTFGSFSSNINIHEAKAKGRICFEDHFNFYYEGHLKNSVLSKDQIIELLNSPPNSLSLFTKKLNNKSYNLFLQYLFGFSKDDRYIEKIFNIFPELLLSISKFKEITTLFGFGGNDVWICGILKNIWKKFGISQIFIWMKEELYPKIKNYKILIDIQYYISSGSKFYFPEEKSKEYEFSNEQIQILHDILITRIQNDIYNHNWFNNNYTIEILYFIFRKNKEVLNTLYQQLSESNQVLDFMDGLLNIGYGESNVRFRTYYFNHSIFDDYVDIDKITKEVEEFIETASNKNINGKTLLSKILFLMPVRQNDPYELWEIKNYCRERNIKLEYEDEFIDD